MVEHVVALDVAAFMADDEHDLIVFAKVDQTRIEDDDGVLGSDGAGIDAIVPTDVEVWNFLHVENAASIFEILVNIRMAVLRHLEMTTCVLHIVDALHEIGSNPLAGFPKKRDTLQALKGLLVEWMLVLAVFQAIEDLFVLDHNAVGFGVKVYSDIFSNRVWKLG